MEYTAVIRTLGKAGEKYQILLNSLSQQTISPSAIYVYIAEGYSLPKETVGTEKYVYVTKGMVSQRALPYSEIDTEYILFLDDDVYLPTDGVEKMYYALISRKADVVSPDVFNNAKRPVLNKIMMAISGRMWPRRDDKKWAYKIMSNSGYSYNANPSQDVYESQSNAGPCFFCSKESFLKIRFQDEKWLEHCSYPLGEDQVMFYKMFRKGLKQLTVFNTGIEHMDAGTTLMSEDKERALLYSDFRFKTIFWHRFIFKPEKNILKKIWSCVSILYAFSFAFVISLLKLRFDILKVKCSAIKSGIEFIESNEYKNLPLI